MQATSCDLRDFIEGSAAGRPKLHGPWTTGCSSLRDMFRTSTHRVIDWRVQRVVAVIFCASRSI
eukprot:4675596-Pleurochrysis_carterae.AAC.1